MKVTDAEVEIVRLLKAGAGGHISGQRISLELGISRTAVWKHIGALRRIGYHIEGSPKKGYRLDPSTSPFNGVEVSCGPKMKLMGRNLFFYSTLDSTNTKAHEIAGQGAEEGTAVIADSQTNGKGRLGREWISPPGVNLYTSIILKPDIPPQEAQTLTLMAAVSVAETVSAYSPVRPTVKWPNDILIDSRKVAGILTEMNSEADRVNFVIVGIGVNLNMTPSGELRLTATSIKEKSGNEVPRAAFAQALYSSVEKWYKVYLAEGFEPVLVAWRGYFASEGKPVRVKGSQNIEGICMGIDGQGALLVRIPSGRTARILAGEVE
jgi:BirA family biotin operon repressor/biotin-[acetyl-CoA-carboxylase] ligase